MGYTVESAGSARLLFQPATGVQVIWHDICLPLPGRAGFLAWTAGTWHKQTNSEGMDQQRSTHYFHTGNNLDRQRSAEKRLFGRVFTLTMTLALTRIISGRGDSTRRL
jgi:hypothetical protein